MKLKITLLFILLLGGQLFAQITVDKNFNLELVEKDSLASARIESALNGFLNEAYHRNYSDKYVAPEHLKTYEFFFNKLAGIGQNSTSYFNPTVLKSYSADGETYRLTIGFYGKKETQAFIYQITELKAVPYQGSYRFYCLFEEHTKHYKQRKMGTVTYHYKDVLDTKKAKEFAAFKKRLAKATKTASDPLDYYCFESLDELLKAYGFLYSARQCNFLCYDLGFADAEGHIYVTGTDNPDYRFGYIGDYLYYNLPNKDQMYWPFVQGVSAYYGGYGLSYDDLNTLKSQFRKAYQEHPNLNFLEEFNKGRGAHINRHFSYYVMSAFLCEALLENKGFDAVLDVVYSGSDGATFFEKLKTYLNVDASNFHEYIVSRIQ